MLVVEEVGIIIVIFILGLFGVLCSVISLIIIYRHPILHNAFGCICATQSVVEGAIILFFAFGATPIVLIWPELSASTLIASFGALSNILHGAGIYFQFLKSINRCWAILFSINYQRIFTIKTSIIIISIFFIISILHSLPYFFPPCIPYYVTTTFIWSFKYPNCTTTFWLRFNLYWAIFLMVMALLGDGITLLYLRKYNKKLSTVNKQLLAKEKRFFFQACITSLVYTVMMIAPYGIRTLVTSTWTRFLSSTANWMAFHALNELIFIVTTLKIGNKQKMGFRIVHFVDPKS